MSRPGASRLSPSRPGASRPSPRRPRKRTPARFAVERDQLDLIHQLRASEARVSDAIVTAFTRSDGNTLAAFGVMLGFVAKAQAKARR